MKDLYIYCAGGVGQEVYSIATRVNSLYSRWQGISFIDDTMGKPNVNGTPVYCYDQFLERCNGYSAEVVIANGEPIFRKILFDKVTHSGFAISSIVDPEAYVSEAAQIGAGAIIYPHACISPGAVLEEDVLVYYNCVIAHDSKIGAHTVMSIAAAVAGNSAIDEEVFLGMNSCVREHVSVEKGVILAMGGVLTANATANGIYEGVPAQRVRENLTGKVFK